MSVKLAVVGATGSVGREILVSLAEADLVPAANVVALASDRSVGSEVSFGEDDDLTVQALNGFDFAGIDYAFFAIDARTAKKEVKRAVEAGAMVIDCSDAFRLEPGVPLVVPGVNDAALGQMKKNICANPSALAILLACVLKPLQAAVPIKRVVVSSYQPVSGAGRQAMDELFTQTRGVYVNDIPTKEHFPKQIAFNVIPQVGAFESDGYTEEEATLAGETRKLVGPDIALTATCVRVPVFIGQAAAVTVEFEGALTATAARDLWKKTPGLSVIDHRADEGYVTPVESAGDDLVFVSRVRDDKTVPHGISFWCVTDNTRKGGGLNAVQILESLLKARSAGKKHR